MKQPDIDINKATFEDSIKGHRHIYYSRPATRGSEPWGGVWVSYNNGGSWEAWCPCRDKDLPICDGWNPEKQEPVGNWK